MKLLIVLLFGCALWASGNVVNSQNLFPLSIIHLNDFHARFEETNMASTACKQRLGQVCIGGLARVMTMVRRLKNQRQRENKNPIFLNIGDNFSGTLWYHLFGWNVTSHFLNIFPADATTLGNHEFNRGIPEVVNFLTHLKSPVLVANIDDSREPSIQGKYRKSLVIVRGGRRIGLIGAVITSTMEISNPGNLRILDEVASVRAEAARLRREQNVNIIIVLSHSGLATDRRMAEQSNGLIDVIVGGHTHALLHRGTPVPGPDIPADTYPIVYTVAGHRTLIVQASAHTKYIGDLTVYFDANGNVQRYEGNTIFMDNSVTPDPQFMAEMRPWKAAVDKVGQRQVGTVQTPLSSRECRSAECNFGSFITDAYVDFIRDHPNFRSNDRWAPVTISMTNAGGIRTGLDRGVVVFDDLYTALPFTNNLSVFELRGQDLLSVLQHSGNSFRNANFLQVSGLRVVYNASRPQNQRVVSVDVLCRECAVPQYERLDVNKWYRMVVPHFIGGGGNGFVAFRNRRNVRTTREIDTDAVEHYFKKRSPVVQATGRRITVLT